MTQQQTEAVVPDFTRGDRMMRSLKHAGVGVQEMADYLGVARNTVSTWVNDRITPGKQTMRLWAMRTGVDLAWLETGCAIRDSNPEPADMRRVQRSTSAAA